MAAWNVTQAAAIKRDAMRRYGQAWDIMSEDAKQNYLRSRVLALLMTQASNEYSSAQRMVQSVLAHL